MFCCTMSYCVINEYKCGSRVSLMFQAWVHHGRMELPHVSGEHLGLSDCWCVCVVCLGVVLHRAWHHHRLHRSLVLLLPG